MHVSGDYATINYFFLRLPISASTERPGGRDSVVIDLLFIVAPIVCWASVFGLCLLFSTLCPSSFAIVLNGKRERERELVALF